MKKYRLYIDESGTHQYSQSDKLDKRYLAITGIAISQEEIVTSLSPKISDLKLFASNDIDEKITLHREEIANRSGIYSILSIPEKEIIWNSKILSLLADVEYTICTVVIDKKQHVKQYVTPAHPYHYCLHLLIERYVQFLEKINTLGDVMAECRGKKEDEMLKSEYSHIYQTGTDYVDKARYQKMLTSKDLKLKPKIGICGLELADLLVLASKLDVLKSHGKIESIASKFNNQIIPILQSKYYRNNNNSRIVGYGKKLI